MDAQFFRSGLEADGYLEVVDRTFDAGTVIGDHGHDYDVRLLVVQGSLTLGCNGTSRTFRTGEVLELDRNIPHTERYDADVATTMIVGRRY